MRPHGIVLLAFCGMVVLLVSSLTQQNHAANSAMSARDEPFIGEVRLVAFNFAPKGWADCNGQMLPISSNTALFSLLGTTFGGDGRTTFALPDLRGRVAVHAGKGPGLEVIKRGQRNGGVKVGKDSNSATSTQAFLGMKYVIAVEGIYPARR